MKRPEPDPQQVQRARRRAEDKTARRTALRQELYERAGRGDLALREALRLMRKIADKSQAEYAALVGVSPRVLIDFERGVGNPTLRSLGKMLAPFGLELTVRRRASAAAVPTGARPGRDRASGAAAKPRRRPSE